MNILVKLFKRGSFRHLNNSSSLNLKFIILIDLTIIFILFINHNHLIEARFKRCFTCRSRGALGDCRDPFNLNSTTFDGQTNTKPSIEATPCASGWCAKIIEDDFGDSIAATERSCMTRPPTDNEERCSETIFENHRDRKVFLCMCYGDLCNSAPESLKQHSSIYSLTMTILGTFIAIKLSNCYTTTTTHANTIWNKIS